MVSCKHCSTQNSLDSTFCKRCGTSIDEVALTDAQTKLDALIEDGNSLFNQGRTEEAMAVAEACVMSNPASVAALSLKVMCHERRGEVAEALECAERIVDLNPDSELDKIKRNALRTRLQSDLRLPEPPDRRIALVGAAAAVVLVACLGVGIARITSRPTDNLAVQRNTGTGESVDYSLNGGTVPNLANSGVGSGNAGTGATNPPVNNPANVATPNPANITPSVPNLRSDDVPAIGRQNPAPQGRNNSFAPTGFRGNPGVLPAPGEEGDRPVRIDPSQLNINPDERSGTVPTPRPPAQNPDSGPDPEPIRQGSGPIDPGPATPPTEDPMKGIEIDVRSGGSPRNRLPGGTAPLTGNGLETLLRVGSEQYQLGNFAAAGRSYEQALRAGGDAIILNQRIGQAYSRLGRNSEAADAYRRCISACEAAISNGTGNRARHEAVKSTAEQALKVLQGG